MSHQERHAKSSKSQRKRSDSGMPQEKLPLLDYLTVIEDTTLTPSLKEALIQGRRSFTPELVATNSERICIGRPTISNPCFRMEKLLPKSVPGSTLSEKGYYPFWDESCQEMSKKLWSHTQTDSFGLALTSSNGFVSKTIADSWFSTKLTSLQNKKWLKISWQSFTSLVADSTDCANTSVKSKKIRIYPDSKLSDTWRKWIAAARWSYNKAMDILVKEHQVILEWLKIPKQERKGIQKPKHSTKYDLRSIVNCSSPEWVTRTPFNPRGDAILRAHSAFMDMAFGDRLKPRFRSCRQPVKSMTLQSSNWGMVTHKEQQLGFKAPITYPSRADVKGCQVNPSEPLCCEMPSDFSILLDRGRWFICFMVPMELETGATDGLIALDPGDRTFLTGFDGKNIVEIGKHNKTRLFHLCQRLDRIQSEIDRSAGRANKRKRFNLRKLAQNLRIKIRDLVDEVHRKVAAFLTKTYKVVLIPRFETSGMTKRNKRKITSNTARSMLNWAHYRFRQTLMHHATKRNCVVIVDDEAYTSKTCSCCGAVNLKLGGAKVFQCLTCNHVIQRDWNGAINIFFKTLTKMSRLLAGFREDTPEYTVESRNY